MATTTARHSRLTNRPDPTAVVIGLDGTTGLQTARLLAGYGFPVLGVAGDLSHPCCRTNVCERVLAADTTGNGLIEVLAQAATESEGKAVLFPCTDISVLLISRWRDQLAPWYEFALPAQDVVELLIDKGRFYSYAQREGLPIPLTFFLRSRTDAEAAAAALRFPCIIKPTLKTAAWKRHSSAKAYRAVNRNELLSLHDRLSRHTELLIAQNWIEGGDGNSYTCNAYFGADSEPLVTFTSRKLRQWPPTGGEGCLSEESCNPVVEQETIRLFKSVGHSGLGYLEMKRDARSAEHLIIEPNIGRPTGRSAAAEAAGVALLHTMYCDLLGRPLPLNRQQSFNGAKWIHARRDLQSAVYHWNRGELTLREWRDSWRGPKTDALFSWRDPVPFWADLLRVAKEHAPGHKARAGKQVAQDAVST